MKKNLLIMVTLSLALLQLLLVSILLVVLITACSEPIPTQLADDPNSNNLKVELISEKPGVYVYTNGYDSTGIIQPLLDKSTFISVSGIKNSNYGKSSTTDYYFTQFSDKNAPIFNKDKKVIGFMGVNMGEVRFNNAPAQMAANKIEFHDHGYDNDKNRDTTIGLKYYYTSKQMNPAGGAKFPYNSVINFKLDQGKMQGHESMVQLDIPTPQEIIGRVKMQGSASSKDLKVDLEWNGLDSGEIEVVLGLFDNNSAPYPLLKVTGNDIGKMVLPRSIMEKLTLGNTKEMLITFIRKKVKEETREFFKDNYIVAQSIHNIKIQLPQSN